MNVLLIWVGLMVIVVAQANESWSNYQVTFGKSYKTETELQLRQKIFNDNLQQIEEHNKKYDQGLVSYKLGLNKFSDLTDDEFAARFKTFKLDDSARGKGVPFNSSGAKSLPDSIDWRSEKYGSVVTGVKNQGNCGGCWAFSTTGSIESHLAIKTGELKSLSEQQLLDCDILKNTGCDGGVVQYAYGYIQDNGLSLEDNYPYNGLYEKCDKTKEKAGVVWLSGYVEIEQNDENDLKLAVGTVGPVSVAINSVPIKQYKEGIFDGTCSDAIDHAVLAVGYGVSESGQSYWIVKNSWGADWGEQGYFRIAIGRNLCGIARQSCYPQISN